MLYIYIVYVCMYVSVQLVSTCYFGFLKFWQIRSRHHACFNAYFGRPKWIAQWLASLHLVMWVQQ